MDPSFNTIDKHPENDIFRVVFFPDRIYHARYLNATRSSRYRYKVQEVRGKHDIVVLKGEVYLDGAFLTNVLRIEYRAERLVEVAREANRFVRTRVKAWIRVAPDLPELRAETMVDLEFCEWVKAYQVELWGTLEAPTNNTHDVKVLAQMGRGGGITRASELQAALTDLSRMDTLELAFREADLDEPFGYAINNPQWDNNFMRSHESPVQANTPSSAANTIKTENYYLTFQRAFYLHAKDVTPVQYRNPLMEEGTNVGEAGTNNILKMRWLVQRELGSNLVYFHEVEIPPGVTEGSHRHIGSEELYFITEGEGVIYMGEGDSPDPKLAEFPTVERDIFGVGRRPCKELPAVPGALLFTKSGGIHGIRNTSLSMALKFVAFGYQSS